MDKSACTGAVPYRSQLFENSDAYYSYQTCGESNQFNTWIQSNAASAASEVTELLDVVLGYLWSTRDRVETEQSVLSQVRGCEFKDQCPCLECSHQSNIWKMKTDFSSVGVNARDDSFGCLARPVSQSYMNVAAKEGEPMERVGYIYFSDHASGSYLGWPAVEWCQADDYDPRLRPWYSSGSTGPKDVVIVIDVSGSMQTAGRYVKAKQAAKALIDTLEWKDFADIILFNNGISAQFSSERLVPMFDERRKAAKSWLENQQFASGGTNFKAALEAAFDVISRSVSSGDTSMCQKAILFLTDGEAEFSDGDFAWTRRQAEQLSVAVFTYALGSGADATITKRLACENKGIFYQLQDGVDLSKVMSRYYEYFAAGVEICTPSFTRYKDAVTDAELWPACLPAYDRSSEKGLLGVSCFDLNVMVDPATMESQDYYDNFVCKVSDLTKQCRQLDLNDCRLEKLRAAVGPASICSALTFSSLPSTCECADPACQDNEDWLDEKGYFCDTWVGDNCYGAMEDWVYSAAGQQAVLAQCKRSCGICPQTSSCQAGQCQLTPNKISSTGCRKERTDKVSPSLIVTEWTSFSGPASSALGGGLWLQVALVVVSAAPG